MSLKYAVLAALLEGEASGYELSKVFDVSLANFWPATPQQLYRELERLAQDGLVEARTVQQERRPNKRMFTLTETGRTQLRSFAAEPPKRPTAVRDELLIKIQAMDGGDPAATRALVEERRTWARGERDRYERVRLRLLDPALMAQLAGQALYASVTTPKKEVQMVSLRPDRSGEMLYLGTYRARRTGSMVVRARQAAPEASSEAKPLFDVKHTFQVKMQSLEARDTSADLEAMQDLAEATGGRYFDYRNMGDIESLLESIPTDPQILSKETRTEIWDGTMFLTLFMLLIGCEWSLRKLWGLL